MKRELFTDDHLLFRESARTFVDREIRPNFEKWRDQRKIDSELWISAGQQDLLGFPVPVEFGGSGIDDFRFNMILTEELASVSLGMASSIGIHTDVVAPYLLELTSHDQQKRWLPRFFTGEMVTAIGMTEPEAGSDLASLKTKARKVTGGWVVSGSKTFITNGMSADLVVVAARTGEGRGDITLFGIESDRPGFSRGRKLDKVGQIEVDTSELFFEDVPVSPEDVIGEINRGFVAMMERLPQERLHVAIANIAHARRQLEVTLEYVTTRKAFGRPVGTFQNSRFVLAELSTKLDVSQAYVDRCVQAHLVGELTPEDAARAKWWSAEIQNQVIDECVQLHGGYGYMTEYEVARAWEDARVSKIWGGTNEIMKEVIGRDLGLAEVRA